jgi:DNA-binding winged helix-turn-helix (wHTH) protein
VATKSEFIKVLLQRLDAGETVSSERLIDDLWGEDPPPTVHTALQGLVASLRKRLEPDRDTGTAPRIIRTVGSGYLLAVDAHSLDANRFKVSRSTGGVGRCSSMNSESSPDPGYATWSRRSQIEGR